MRSNYYKCCLFVFFQLILFVVKGQSKLPEEVQNRLRGKTKFYEIKSTIQDHFKNQLNTIPVNDLKQRKKLMRELK